MKNNRYLFFGGSLEAFVNFRLNLIDEILECSSTESIMCVYFGNLEKIGIPKNKDKRLIWLGLNSSHIGSIFRDIGALYKFLGIIRSFKPTRIIAFNAKPIFYTGIFRRLGLYTGPLIALFEGMGLGFSAIKDQSMRGVFIRAVLRPSLTAFTSWIFLNDHDRDWLTKQMLISQNAPILNIMGIGVDNSCFRKTSSFSSHWHKKSIGFAGRFIKQKGPHVFVKIARLVHESRPDIQFHMAGRKASSTHSVSEAEIDNWLYSGRVKSIQYYSDMSGFYEQMSLLVLPTVYDEGLPAVAMECQSMGIPILLNDIAQVVSAVSPKQSHHLIADNTAVTFANLILKYLEDEELYLRAAQTAFDYAQEHFYARNINQKVLSFIEPERS